MVIVPFAQGVALRARTDGLAVHLVPLFAFWLLGYFAFHAASQWLKAPARRRAGFVRPAWTYALASAACGVTTLVLGGPAMLGWVPVYLPLLVPALWLAAQRRERATLGGALTTAAAAVMVLVARYDSPWALLAAPDVRTPLLVAALAFAYFFGTVLYVKTNLRERGNPRYLWASVGWHAAWTSVAALAALAGWPTWWTVFFAATTVRAAWVPRQHPAWTPKRIGVLEVAFSAALLLGTILA